MKAVNTINSEGNNNPKVGEKGKVKMTTNRKVNKMIKDNIIKLKFACLDAAEIITGCIECVNEIWECKTLGYETKFGKDWKKKMFEIGINIKTYNEILEQIIDEYLNYKGFSDRFWQRLENVDFPIQDSETIADEEVYAVCIALRETKTWMKSKRNTQVEFFNHSQWVQIQNGIIGELDNVEDIFFKEALKRGLKWALDVNKDH